MAPATDRIMLRITQATAQRFVDWGEGVHLFATAGQPLDELREKAVSDRLALAAEFLETAARMQRTRPPHYRDAVSRYYYSMYHAMRAAALYRYRGDDHSSHAELPGKTPADFPDSSLWQNELKNARELRNQADYDPYPAQGSYWKLRALQMGPVATRLVTVVRGYLASKGCRYI